MAPIQESPLYPEQILVGLDTHLLPSEIACYAHVGSTMDIVRERVAEGAPEGLLVLAEEQTAGRGRMGRHWASPAGSNLYLSLLLRPTWLAPADAFRLTMLVAVSLCTAVEAVTHLVPRLKWPNDLLIPSSAVDPTLAKAAGILVDLSLRGHSIATANIGCGINVNSAPRVDAGLRYPATSLAAACGRRIDRLALLQEFLQQLDAGYVALQAGRHDEIVARWQELLVTIGTDVGIATAAGPVVGFAEGVAPSGALLVRESDGTLRTITAGDVQA